MREAVIRPLNSQLEDQHPFGISTDKEVLDYLSKFIDVNDSRSLAVVKTATIFNVDNLRLEGDSKLGYSAVVNLKRVNDIRSINSFFRAVNSKLKVGGIFIGCVETYVLRKQRILKKYPWGFNYLYYTMDYLGKRVAPKIPIAKNLYQFLTDGRNRVLSKTECLGRAYYNGFEIISTNQIENLLFFVAKKVGVPKSNESPWYGPLFRMKRVGHKGKMIYVYKLRTMHPFSEYLQEYVYQQNNLEIGGKFHKDFRVTTYGRILRKFFIDEIPMIWNLFRNQIKLVGIRPLTEHYLSLYDQDLQEMRLQVKPGLIPPYYVDLPKDLQGIMDSERRYLAAYKKAPIRTDFRYFILASRNILIKKILGR